MFPDIIKATEGTSPDRAVTLAVVDLKTDAVTVIVMDIDTDIRAATGGARGTGIATASDPATATAFGNHGAATIRGAGSRRCADTRGIIAGESDSAFTWTVSASAGTSRATIASRFQ